MPPDMIQWEIQSTPMKYSCGKLEPESHQDSNFQITENRGDGETN